MVRTNTLRRIPAHLVILTVSIAAVLFQADWAVAMLSVGIALVAADFAVFVPYAFLMCPVPRDPWRILIRVACAIAGAAAGIYCLNGNKVVFDYLATLSVLFPLIYRALVVAITAPLIVNRLLGTRSRTDRWQYLFRASETATEGTR